MPLVTGLKIYFRVVEKATETKDVAPARRKTRWRKDRNWPINKLWGSKRDSPEKTKWSWRSSTSLSQPMAWSSKIDKGQAVVLIQKKLTFSKLWRHKNRINNAKTNSHNKNENLPSPNPLESHRPRAPPKDQAARVVARLLIIMEPWDSLICRSKRRRRRNHMSQIRKR